MNYREQYHVLCDSLGYNAMDLGYGYATSPKEGTVYLFFGDPDSIWFDEDFRKFFEEFGLTGWPQIKFQVLHGDKRLKNQIGNLPYNYPYAHVFHLWKKTDVEVLEALRTRIDALVDNMEHERAYLAGHYDDDYYDDDHDEEE